MKFQACRFKRTKSSHWEPGVAVLKIFDLSDIEFIIDEDGKKLKTEPWNYELQGPADRAFHSVDLNVVIFKKRTKPGFVSR